jgi:hypothetical protein
MKYILTVFALLLMFDPAFAGYKTVVDRDKFSGTIIIGMSDNKLGLPKGEEGCRTDNATNGFYFGDTHVQFLAEKVFPKGVKKGTLRVCIDFKSTDWLFMKRMQILVDGKPSEFAIGDHHSVVERGCHEWGSFIITPKKLKEIASASSVQIRIIGKDARYDACFNDKNFKNLQTYLEDLEAETEELFEE